ncbi:hypothetical protein DP939_26390 [Spongiactinospora rosea]|uniref:Uncharacterized protein n=1 Tax=Spongiactinospora rosea TaxID=2248750 RepID=A0A366LUP8_9ACTN|nr:hypothetical protein DP939_26390 [Spongiactinospora rosea]
MEVVMVRAFLIGVALAFGVLIIAVDVFGRKAVGEFVVVMLIVGGVIGFLTTTSSGSGSDGGAGYSGSGGDGGFGDGGGDGGD